MKDKYLFDASSLVLIIGKIANENILKEPVSLLITPLTPFEYGNAFWKAFIRREITLEEFEKALMLLEKLIDIGILSIVRVENFNEIAKISARRKISFYDASYVFLAKEENATLVTEDNGLKEACLAERVDVIDSQTFLKRLKIVHSNK